MCGLLLLVSTTLQSVALGGQMSGTPSCSAFAQAVSFFVLLFTVLALWVRLPVERQTGRQRETRSLSRAGGTDRPAGSPEASVSTRASAGLPRASVRLGQSAAWTASTRAGHLARAFHVGAAESATAVERRCGAARAAGRHAYGRCEKARLGQGGFRELPGVVESVCIVHAVSIRCLRDKIDKIVEELNIGN